MAQKFLAIVASIAAAASLAACGSSGSGSSNGGGAVGDPEQGGTLRVLAIAEPRSLEPALAQNNSSSGGFVGNAIYGQLVTGNPAGEVLPAMTTWTTEDEGLTWDVELKSGIEFSDGTPFTAEALKVAWDEQKDPANGSAYIGTAAYVENVEVVDDTHAKFHLVGKSAVYPANLLGTSLNWVASPEALKLDQEQYDEAPVGAGPYMLKSWARGARMELVPNPNYFEEGKPYLDGINISLVPDAAQRLDTLISGSADLVMGGDNKSRARAEETAGVVVHDAFVSSASGMVMNMTKPPFDNPIAREAMALAIEAEPVSQAAFDGKAPLVSDLFSDKSELHTDEELRVNDPERAQELLDQYAEEEGKPLAFTIVASSTSGGPQAAESIQAQLGAYDNVEVSVEVQEAIAAFQRMLAKDFEATLTGHSFVDPDSSLFTFYHSTASYNPSGVNDDELDAAIIKARESSDLAVRAEGYQELEQRIKELWPMVYLYRNESSIWTSDSVQGVELYGLASVLAQGLWLNQ